MWCLQRDNFTTTKKMSAFKKTEKLSKAVSLINELELKSLYYLLQIILLSDTFSRKESEFVSSFDEQVVSAIKYIMEKALYLTLKPEKLYNGLIELEVSFFGIVNLHV
jgi:hypothetical protein